jgi:acyl dehydratase
VSEAIFLEDLFLGRRFTAGSVMVDAEEVKRFAALYDPQPFHMDEESGAAHPLFGRLAASGWHTAGIVGGGGEIQWTKPVYPGDTLRVEIEVLEVAPSRSRPDRGSALMRNTTFNQHDEPVQIFTVRVVVPKRPV